MVVWPYELRQNIMEACAGEDLFTTGDQRNEEGMQGQRQDVASVT